MSEILENYVEEEETPVVEIFREAAGKSVSLDYFLYSCFEYKATIDAIDAEWEAEHRWEKNGDDFKSNLASLKKWGEDTFPVFTTKDPVDYELVGDYVDATVRVAQKFSELVTETNIENGELTQAIASVFGEHMFLEKFLQWISKEDINTELDLTSVPPQGKYAYILKKQMQRESRSRDSRSRDNRSRDGRSRDGRPNRNGKRGDSQRNGKPNGPRRDRNQGSGDEQKKEAISDAKAALNQLKKDKKLNEVVLAPRNSFLRRIQHQYISENGFESNSTGEGRQRTIKVSRK